MKKIDLELKIFQVGYGDCFSLSFTDGSEKKTIFIDSGYAKTFHTTLAAELSLRKTVDIWIFTHIDGDHIGGTASFMKTFDEKNPPNFLKQVWLNSFESPKLEDSLPMVRDEFKSYKQAIQFRDYLKHFSVSNVKDIIAGHKYSLGSANIVVLAPSVESYHKFKAKWIKEEKMYESKTLDKAKGKKSNDYEKQVLDFDTLLLPKDDSVENGSSIAFIFELGKFRILFLGDSHANDVVLGLLKLGYSSEKKINLDYIKLSHHGSKFNLSNELLDIVNCKNFIISTDGSDSTPDKFTLSKIVLANLSKSIGFYFNYEKDIFNNIFSEEEIVLYDIRIIFPGKTDRFLQITHSEATDEIYTD